MIARRPVSLSLPGTITRYQVDVTDEQALAATAQDFIARHGPPDLVIANAGVSAGTRGEEIRDIASLRRVLEVNVTGLAATLAAFAPAMRTAGRGTLAGIASVAGFRGLAGNGAYSASKSAAITWLESLRTETFLLPPDEGARRIARAIARRPRLAVVPWQMALVSVALRAMPGWLFDRLAARAPRKPRT